MKARAFKERVGNYEYNISMSRVLLSLLGGYAVLVVATLVLVALGGYPPPFWTPLTTLIGFAFSLLHACQRMGGRRALLLLGLVFVVSLTFESLGVASGWIYGPYHYTDKLGPMFLGLVPGLIPLAWFMMMYPSLVMAERLVPPGVGTRYDLSVAAVGGVVMTAWDLVMDPLMTHAGHWVWEVQGAYFGVPLQNFWGWWLTTFVVFLLFLRIGGARSLPSRIRLDPLALLLYLLTAAGDVVAAFLAGLDGVALAGLFATLPWWWAGWVNISRSSA